MHGLQGIRAGRSAAVLVASLWTLALGQVLVQLDVGQHQSWGWDQEACVAVAAQLAPCLTANSASSSLTSLEEASCCASLSAFEQAGCFCMDVLLRADSLAYRKRLAALAGVQKRCTWQPVQCIYTFGAGEELDQQFWPLTHRQAIKLPLREADYLADELGFWLEEEERLGPLAKAATFERQTLPLGQGAESLMHWTESVAAREQLAALAKVFSKVMDLARTVAASKTTKVEVTFEVTLETTVGQKHSAAPLHVGRHQQMSWWAQLPRAAVEQPLLYASLGVFLVVFVLLCLVRCRPAGKARQCGIVVAADEAHALHKPLF